MNIKTKEVLKDWATGSALSMLIFEGAGVITGVARFRAGESLDELSHLSWHFPLVGLLISTVMYIGAVGCGTYNKKPE